MSLQHCVDHDDTVRPTLTLACMWPLPNLTALGAGLAILGRSVEPRSQHAQEFFITHMQFFAEIDRCALGIVIIAASCRCRFPHS